MAENSPVHQDSADSTVLLLILCYVCLVEHLVLSFFHLGHCCLWFIHSFIRSFITTILLGSNLGQVVYSHCLPSLLSSKKPGYKRQYSDWVALTV